MAENEKDSKYELFSLMPTLYCRLSLFIPPSLSHTLSLSLSLYIYIYISICICMYSVYIYLYMYVCRPFNEYFGRKAINHPCKEVSTIARAIYCPPTLSELYNFLNYIFFNISHDDM